MFISKLENKESLCNAVSEIYKNRDAKKVSFNWTVWKHIYMRPEVNSNQFEILLQGKITLRCKVTSLLVFI